MTKKKTILDFQRMKKEGEKIAWLTCYDYHTAKFEERAGVDIILMGDSVGGCVYGYPDDGIRLNMDQCIVHAEAVRRGAPNTFLVGDMPFLSYEVSPEEAVRNAGRYHKEARVDAVKLEGGRRISKSIKAVVDGGMVVFGHIGLLSQSLAQIGGHRVQGRTAESAYEVIQDARAVQEAGAAVLCLEGVTAEVAKFITDDLKIPVLGIGCGIDCDGQVLIVNDVLGITEGFEAKFFKQYGNAAEYKVKAIQEFVKDVKERKFPTRENWNVMNAGELERLMRCLRRSGKPSKYAKEKRRRSSVQR